MNQTIRHQVQHRSIREFTQQKVPPDLLLQVLEVATHTASSNHLQGWSMIHVADPALKGEIALVCRQPYVARLPEFVIFIVDTWRNRHIALAQGDPAPAAEDMNLFTQGFTDACLAAQNMTNAIESLGLGACFFGSILNDVPRLIQLLQLPRLTFPVVGVGFGYPAQAPQMKPRLPLSLRLMENTYAAHEDYLALIKDYDEQLSQYYDLRDASRRVDSFSLQVQKRLHASDPARDRIARHILSQGFNFKLDGEAAPRD